MHIEPISPSLPSLSHTQTNNKPNNFLGGDSIINLSLSAKFYLDPDFMQSYKQRIVEWGPLGEVTYRRTYAREKASGAREEWFETIERVVNGVYTYQKWHCLRNSLPWSNHKAQRSAQTMYDLIFNFKFLPPGRGLWMAGTDYVERFGGACLNNCGYVSTKNIDDDFAAPFSFLMDMSMLGVGVGGNCGSQAGGAGKVNIVKPQVRGDIHVVPDTREGWVELTARVLNAYVGKGSLPAEIDYSSIRPAGTPIKSFGGVAAGSGPLVDLIAGIKTILEPLIGKPITSNALGDLYNRIGKCVVSGNVRRSAIILLGDAGDSEFADRKNYKAYPYECSEFRWASNNSTYSRVGMDYSSDAERTALNGEPGYFWLENAQNYGRMGDAPNYKDLKAAGTNPCSEQTLEDFELCCLVETFPSRHDSYAEYERTLKYAYLYAKTITLIPTHNARTNAVVGRNRRIGCSQSGIVENFSRIGRREHLNWCDNGYTYVQKLDGIYSSWLCVPRSKKTTSVKPSGTVSLLPGVTPGIHYPHSEYYYRTIRIAQNSTLIPALKKANYRIEDDVTDSTRAVVYFAVHEANCSRYKADVTMWEQLENAAAMQHYWADNQVSVTITFNKNEAKDIKHALELYETRLKSVSFLPESDHGYEQAVYQTIDKGEYDAYISQLTPLELNNVVKHEVTEKFCDGDKCII